MLRDEYMADPCQCTTAAPRLLCTKLIGTAIQSTVPYQTGTDTGIPAQPYPTCSHAHPDPEASEYEGAGFGMVEKQRPFEAILLLGYALAKPPPSSSSYVAIRCVYSAVEYARLCWMWLCGVADQRSQQL